MIVHVLNFILQTKVPVFLFFHMYCLLTFWISS